MMGHDGICPISMLMYMYYIFFTDVYWHKEHTIYLLVDLFWPVVYFKLFRV